MCKADNELNQTNKYLFKSISDNHVPYGYQNSDLKQLYLSKTSLQNKYVAPIVTDELLKGLQSRK